MAASKQNESSRPWRERPTGRYPRQLTNIPASLSFVFKDLEERVATFSSDTAKYPSELAQLRHVKPVASYSWVDGPVPTMVVPGSPWIWADDRPPVRQVPFDTGVQYIDHDASKMGNHSPMLPLFAAIDAMHDDFPYEDLDLVTSRSGLRKLLRYVDNTSKNVNFRMDIDLAGKTCLFTRQEENATVVGQYTGYGHEYLKAATRVPPGCENMVVHYRIVTCEFGSLKILLGSTADACIESKNKEGDLVASLSRDMADMTVKTTKPAKHPPAGLNIKFTPHRSLVPQSDLIEVKTRAAHRNPDWKEIYPQLYLSQTAWLYMAKHNKGIFQNVEKISLMGEEMKPYAEMMDDSFVKLKNLLKEILKAVRAQGEGVPLSLVLEGGTLSLWRRRKGSGKPPGEEITSRFKAVSY